VDEGCAEFSTLDREERFPSRTFWKKRWTKLRGGSPQLDRETAFKKPPYLRYILLMRPAAIA